MTNPVDMQNLISKATEVARTQQIDAERAQHRQQHLGQQFSAHVQKEIGNVTDLKDAADARLETRRDSKPKRDRDKAQRSADQAGPAGQSAADAAEEPGKGAHVDVTI